MKIMSLALFSNLSVDQQIITNNERNMVTSWTKLCMKEASQRSRVTAKIKKKFTFLPKASH
jgi:hypothetical protein